MSKIYEKAVKAFDKEALRVVKKATIDMVIDMVEKEKQTMEHVNDASNFISRDSIITKLKAKREEVTK